ncbi:MAG: hypothetical protein QNL31_02555 [Flavobacteriaceae bacterium]
MNSKLSIILIIATLLSSCTSNKNDLEESNLKGKIWKLKESRYEGEEKFGKYQIGDKRYYGHQLYIFNEEGNILESEQLDRKGKIEKISKYSYDEKGNCIEITTYEDDKVINKQVNQIDNNQIIEVQVFDDDGELTERYQYDYSGSDISGGRIFNSDGSLNLTFQNEMSGGLLSKQIVKDSLEQITSIRTYDRNKQGDILTQKIEYPKDTTEYTYTFQYDYDKKENWLKQYQFDKDGEIDDILVRNIVYYDDSKSAKTDNDFVGMWFVVDDNDWIEFRADKKYDSGYKDRIRETGNWEIDAKQQILTFRADDPDDSRKYKYDFEGYQMILFTIQGEEKLRLEKR